LPTFGVNYNSPKLRFSESDFYVKIKGYGQYSCWAKIVKETADNAVNFIRKHCNFEETIRRITAGVIKANQIPQDLDKRKHTGILRVPRNGWTHGSDWDDYDLVTRYSSRKSKYSSYAERLNITILRPLKNPYNDISLSRPTKDINGNYIKHGDPEYIPSSFERIKEIYDNLHKNYIEKEIETKDMEEVNASIAEIRWILAHATPWERGSDAISNTFIRSIYKAMGIKTYPLKNNVSLDLEAYCTELKDYKKKFESYFSQKPSIIE
jgi:hypothetical protein